MSAVKRSLGCPVSPRPEVEALGEQLLLGEERDGVAVGAEPRDEVADATALAPHPGGGASALLFGHERALAGIQGGGRGRQRALARCHAQRDCPGPIRRSPARWRFPSRERSAATAVRCSAGRAFRRRSAAACSPISSPIHATVLPSALIEAPGHSPVSGIAGNSNSFPRVDGAELPLADDRFGGARGGRFPAFEVAAADEHRAAAFEVAHRDLAGGRVRLRRFAPVPFFFFELRVGDEVGDGGRDERDLAAVGADRRAGGRARPHRRARAVVGERFGGAVRAPRRR